MQPDQWASLGHISVWIVEDNPDFRETIRDEIDSAPDLAAPQEHAFGSGEELFEFLHDHFAPEVILVDICLPGMSGLEVLGRRERLWPQTGCVGAHGERRSVAPSIS